jgi:glycerol-3-phosphate O-acyltransferase/dihydroxyacetone phosphate acyltransferase
MRNTSLPYAITRLIFKPAIRIFYKKIQIRNFKNLPDQDAVFICSNHVNAFMDAVSVQVHTRRQWYSLARGDAFNKPWIRWLLTKWKLIPIYRLSEGAENLKKNESTFSRSREVLTNGNPLIIFPEAICVQERRIRKLKKGAARIAFGVEEQNNWKANLLIIPLGLNYSRPYQFRSNLFINFGEPIYTSDYIELYKQDKAKAILALTNAIELAMKKLVIHVQNKENDNLVEVLFDIFKPEWLLEQGLDPENLEDDFSAGKAIAGTVNQLFAGNSHQLELVREKLFAYTLKLKELHLDDYLLESKAARGVRGPVLFSGVMKIAVGMPFFLLGVFMNYIPYRISYAAADKLAREIEFYASIQLTIGWFAWIGYYLLQLLFVLLVFHSWLLTGICALLIPLSGLFALSFHAFLKTFTARRKFFKWKLSEKDEYEHLIRQRKELFQLLHSGFLTPSQP